MLFYIINMEEYGTIITKPIFKNNKVVQYALVSIKNWTDNSIEYDKVFWVQIQRNKSKEIIQTIEIDNKSSDH
jgi:hypothetical protein